MHYKSVKAVSDILFWIAVILGGYAVIRTGITYIKTPPGVCPISSYRHYVVYAILFSIASLLLTWVNNKRMRKKDRE
jgi:ABC-type Na+ efflux pump permease subunit